MTTQIGAQMYTIRDHCKTPADIAASCAKLSKIGYQAVQVSALGPIEPKELAKILKDNGLTCAATHARLEEMKNTSACIDYHKTLGCQYTAIGGFGFGGKSTPAEWDKFIDDLNAVASTLAKQGVHVGYHNHSHEWAPAAAEGAVGGTPGTSGTTIEHLLRRLGKDVWFELDTYWVAHGGGDPAAWIDRVKGRIPAVHFKDMSITPKREQKMCEIGSGNLNWPAILASCKRAGVQWYLVERDSGDLDPFESLKISLNNMKAMGLK